MREPIRGEAILLLGLLFVCLAVGCDTVRVPDAPQKHGLADPPSAASLAILSRADASDGNVDKVISKCVTCRLGMDGKPEHSVNYGGYAVHLCSEECKKAFSGDPEKALRDLNLPEEKK